MAEGHCELCQREGLPVTRHHLIPRAVHRRPRTARLFEPHDLQGRVAMLCHPCHKFIHSVLSEKELAASYNTLDTLLAHPDVAKFVGWVSNKPAGLTVGSARRRS